MLFAELLAKFDRCSRSTRLDEVVCRTRKLYYENRVGEMNLNDWRTAMNQGEVDNWPFRNRELQAEIERLKRVIDMGSCLSLSLSPNFLDELGIDGLKQLREEINAKIYDLERDGYGT